MNDKSNVYNLLKGRKFTLAFIFFLFVAIFAAEYISIRPKELKIGLGAIPGDVNGDGVVDIIDFQLLSNSFGKSSGQSGFNTNADFNHDNVVDILDFQVLSNNFGKTGTATVTPRVSATPTPNITQGPTPPPGIGIWTSKSELANVPITGQAGCDSFCTSAWNAIINIADSSWGSANLTDYAGLGHSQGIWAGAVAYAKLSSIPGREADAQKYYNKVVQALNAAVGTEIPALPSSGGGKTDGSLALARQFPRYVMAADLLGITNWQPGYKGFRNFVDYIAHTKFTFRPGDGGKTFAEGHDNCTSNGNAMSGGARIVSDVYLGDNTDLAKAWLTFRRYTGDTSVGPDLCINPDGQTWFYANYNSAAHLGINPKGTTCYGKSYPADGVLPADQGRGGVCPSSPSTAAGYTQYPWEGLQGAFLQAYVLYRKGFNLNGKNPFEINDSALLRAVQYQWYLQSKFGGSWYDRSRAAWVKHLANKFYGFKPLQYDPIDGGRNMSLTQWINK